MLRFQYINFFIGLAAVPILLLLFFLLIRWKRKTARVIGDEKLVKEMTRNFSPRRFTIKFIMILLAFAAGVIALANLRSPQGTEKVTRNGIDVMIALDVSMSMLAEDIKPSRLERAKQVLGKLIDKLGNNRIGIVVFAGRAYLQMPLTGDQGAAKMYLSTATPDVVPTQGTVISEALQMCYSSFDTKEKKYKAVVLVSDGEDHDEGAVKMAGEMADEGIVIHTVGIGSPQGATLIDESTKQIKKDINGNIVVSKLNEEALRSIAEKGKGTYQLFSNADEVVTNLNAQLSSMDQRTVTEDALVNYKNYFPYFLGLALLLLLIEFFIAERRKPRVNRQATGLKPLKNGFALLICLVPAALFAQTDKATILKGNDAYAKKDYEGAATHYKKALEKDQADPVAQFNLGNALFRSNKPDDAVSAYTDAAAAGRNAEERSRSFYNKGVVLQNNKKLPECIEAYKQALKLNPDDDDARQNLQKALLQQKQQEQKEKKDKEKKKPKEDPKKKEQQKPKDEEKNDQPKPQPSKLSKKDAEEKLKALLQQEKNLQDKLKKINTSTLSKPEKDW